MKLTTTELLRILDNQWASTKDIMAIGCIGNNQALQLKRQIKFKAEQEGYFVPKNLVPMEQVVNYFKINISYLKKISSSNKNE